MERQIDGLTYEKTIISYFHFKNSTSYTSHYDAFDSEGLGVQIKYKKSGMLMMSSPKPYLEVNENFILVIGEKDINRKCFVNFKKLKKLFESEDFYKRVRYCEYVLKSVTNKHDDDAKFRQLFKKEKDARIGRLLAVQCKRDHKNQKRVQWAIPKKNLEIVLNTICDKIEIFSLS